MDLLGGLTYCHGYGHPAGGHLQATSIVEPRKPGKPCLGVTAALAAGRAAVDGVMMPGDDRGESESSAAEQDDSSPSSADAGVREEVRTTPFRIPSTVNADGRRGLAAGGLPQSCLCL